MIDEWCSKWSVDCFALSSYMGVRASSRLKQLTQRPENSQSTSRALALRRIAVRSAI
jgi:hypothetical protein